MRRLHRVSSISSFRSITVSSSHTSTPCFTTRLQLQQMPERLVDVKASHESTGVFAESFNEMRIPLDEPLRESHKEKGKFVFELSDL